MGVPTSDVGYTSAMPMREEDEVHKDMWWHWKEEMFIRIREVHLRTGLENPGGGGVHV